MKPFAKPRIIATGRVDREFTTTTVELFERVDVETIRCKVCDCEIRLAGHPAANESASTDASITSHLRSKGHARGVGQLERFGHDVTDYAITYRIRR